MMRLSFRFRHENCELNLLSIRYPEVTLADWCNYRREFLEISSRDPGILGEVRERISRLAGHILEPVGSTVDGREEALAMTCFHKRGSGIDEVIEENGGLVLYPIVYHEGWEHYRVIALDESRFKKMINKLDTEGEVRIQSKERMKGSIRESFVVSTSELLAGLTRKQAEALFLAVENGYYEVPRRTKFEDIAKLRNTPKTTFEEHVRKAESKVIKSVAPYISLQV